MNVMLDEAGVQPRSRASRRRVQRSGGARGSPRCGSTSVASTRDAPRSPRGGLGAQSAEPPPRVGRFRRTAEIFLQTPSETFTRPSYRRASEGSRYPGRSCVGLLRSTGHGSLGREGHDRPAAGRDRRSGRRPRCRSAYAGAGSSVGATDGILGTSNARRAASSSAPGGASSRRPSHSGDSGSPRPVQPPGSTRRARSPRGRRRGWDVAALQFSLAWHGFPSGPLRTGSLGAAHGLGTQAISGVVGTGGRRIRRAGDARQAPGRAAEVSDRSRSARRRTSRRGLRPARQPLPRRRRLPCTPRRTSRGRGFRKSLVRRTNWWRLGKDGRRPPSRGRPDALRPPVANQRAHGSASRDRKPPRTRRHERAGDRTTSAFRSSRPGRGRQSAHGRRGGRSRRY